MRTSRLILSCEATVLGDMEYNMDSHIVKSCTFFLFEKFSKYFCTV